MVASASLQSLIRSSQTMSTPAKNQPHPEALHVMAVLDAE
jgi:hypothetical protein